MNVACDCGKDYEMPAAFEGKSFVCKACGKRVHVPFAWRVEELTETLPDVEPPAAAPTDPLAALRTYRHSRVMSNKDMLTFSLGRFVKCHPLSAYLPLMILFSFPLVMAMANLSWMVGLFIGFIVAAIVFSEGPAKRARVLLHDGMLCAAVVIKTNPYAVAVLINQSQDGSANKLAIGVKQQHLGNMSGGRPQKGDRLLVTAMQLGQPVDGAYADFKAFAVNCGCDDLDQILKASSKVNPADWVRLETELSTTKFKIGDLMRLTD